MAYRYDFATGEPVNVDACRTDSGRFRVTREWVTASGSRELVGLWAASLTDTSSEWSSNPPTYDPACGWCWLGVGHTADAHTVSMLRTYS